MGDAMNAQVIMYYLKNHPNLTRLAPWEAIHYHQQIRGINERFKIQ